MIREKDTRNIDYSAMEPRELWRRLCIDVGPIEAKRIIRAEITINNSKAYHLKQHLYAKPMNETVPAFIESNRLIEYVKKLELTLKEAENDGFDPTEKPALPALPKKNSKTETIENNSRKEDVDLVQLTAALAFVGMNGTCTKFQAIAARSKYRIMSTIFPWTAAALGWLIIAISGYAIYFFSTNAKEPGLLIMGLICGLGITGGCIAYAQTLHGINRWFTRKGVHVFYPIEDDPNDSYIGKIYQTDAGVVTIFKKSDDIYYGYYVKDKIQRQCESCFSAVSLSQYVVLN